jgi:CdiI immunity protein
MSAPTGSSFDRARYLFGAYFHQDCLVDDQSWREVVTRFRDEHDPGIVREIREALLELLSTSDDQGVASFVASCSSLDPAPLGLTVRAWVESPSSSISWPVERLGRPRAKPTQPLVSAPQKSRTKFSAVVSTTSSARGSS